MTRPNQSGGGDRVLSENTMESYPDNPLNKKGQKSIPPTNSPCSSKELFSSTKHSMDYVTERGVMLRTGYHDKMDWYFLVVKEKLDNAIDFMWRNYPGDTNAIVMVAIMIDKDRQNFTCGVSNTNSRNVPVFQNLDKILSFDMRYGSKQNEHIISRGMLGDAMKQIATFPYVLMHAKAGEAGTVEETAAFTSKQWDYPMVIKANGLRKEIKIEVDKASQIIKPIITEVREAALEDIHTEVSSTLPVVDDISTYGFGSLLDIDKIEKYCRKYSIFTTDITFVINIADYSRKKKEGLQQQYSIKVNALHSIPTRWNNTSSIHSYAPAEFTAKIMGVEDKEAITVYDVLQTFKEGSQIKKDSDLQMTIAEFIHVPLRAEKLESLYSLLKEKLKPAEKLSLPYSHISNKERKKALAARMGELYGAALEVSGNYLDTDKAVYKLVHGKVYEETESVQYPYAFEIIAVPINEDLIRADKYGYETDFIGAVNYTISPRGNNFQGSYEWDIKKNKKKGKKKNDLKPEPMRGHDISDVLQAYNFQFYRRSNSPKFKRPCIIAANLISPKVTYQGHDKSRIDSSPFTKAIIEAVEEVSKGIQTFRALGIDFEDESKPTRSERRYSALPRYKQKTVFDIIEELLLPRIRLVQSAGHQQEEEVTSIQTQDSLWYNALPLFEQYKNVMRTKKQGQPDRAGFKAAIKEVCEAYGVRREQLGIIASPWGVMYFEDKWQDISFDSLRDLAEQGTDIIFIEKRDIVQTLGQFADKWGVALINTHGILSDYTKDLAELAENSGANIAIFTDYDIPGLLIASKLTESVIWLGVDERMLDHFGITHENKQSVVPYRPKKDRIDKDTLTELLERDTRFSDIDIDFLQHEKVEIDAVLAHVGAARLWNYIKDTLGEEYPTRNYNRVIDSMPDTLKDHYPDSIKKLNEYYDNHAEEITATERQDIEDELEEVEGFIDVEEKRKEIDKRCGDIIESDSTLNKIAKAIEKLDREKGYDIIMTAPEGEEAPK